MSSCLCSWREECDACRPRERIKPLTLRDIGRGYTFTRAEVQAAIADRYKAMDAFWRPGDKR